MFWIVAVLVFLVSAIVSMLLANYAQRFNLIARPGQHRRNSKETPTVGGLAMGLAISLGILFVAPEHKLLLFPLIFVCIVGALDDRYKLPFWWRFIAQGLAATGMIYLTGAELESLGLLFSESNVMLGAWSKPMTVFATIGVINAINMSDGLDGLAGSLLILILITLLAINGYMNNLIWIVIFSISGFLLWNLRLIRPYAKVFMGDSGSTMLGLVLAYLLIQYSQAENGILPVMALWLMAMPLIDAVAVLIARPIHGRSPFSADRNHYHNQISDSGFGANKTVLLALLIQGFFIGVGVLAMKFNIDQTIQLCLFLGIFFIYLIKVIRYANEHSASQ